MSPNKYAFSGSTQGLNAPASFGENWGSNVGSPAFTNPYTAGQGINPNGMSLYDTSTLDNMMGYSPMSTAVPSAPEGLFSSLGKWASESGFTPTKDAAGITTGGWGAPAIQGISGLMNGFMAMKQYGLSKDIFENNKQQFERNFGAQKNLTNLALNDKFTRRNNDMVANGMKPTQSVEDSMKRYGVA